MTASGMPPAASASAAAGPGLLVSIWTSGLWKFMPYVYIYMTGLALLFPILPTIITNGFASDAAGRPMDCQTFSLQDSPRECRDAHAQAVTWGSYTSFVQGAILSFMFAPISGHLSDIYGRKPFMILGIIIGLLPVLAIMVHLWGWMSIVWYYPIDALNGLVSSLGMTLTAVADIMRPEHRAASTAFITAMFSIALITGPIIGGYLDPISAVYACLGLMLVATVYLILVVPECAPRLRKPAPSAPHHSAPAPPRPAPSGSTQPLWRLSTGWQVLAKSSWYMRVAVIWGLVSVMANGTANVSAQYFQMQLGFTPADQAHVMVVSASVSLATKVTVLGLLIYYLGDQWTMAVGLLAYTAEFSLMAGAVTKLEALTAVGVGAVGAIVWPATIALQSSRADPTQWGAVSGALQAVGSLASGIGPIIFATLFSAFSQQPNVEEEALPELPYFPQVVWYVAACLAMVAVLLTATLHWGDTDAKAKHAACKAPADEFSEVAAHDEGPHHQPVLGQASAEKEGRERERHGAPPTVDAWLFGRAWSMRNGLAVAGALPQDAGGVGADDSERFSAVGEEDNDLEQPLLLSLQDEGEAKASS